MNKSEALRCYPDTGTSVFVHAMNPAWWLPSSSLPTETSTLLQGPARIPPHSTGIFLTALNSDLLPMLLIWFLLCIVLCS